jgi:hypothetical protein
VTTYLFPFVLVNNRKQYVVFLVSAQQSVGWFRLLLT